MKKLFSLTLIIMLSGLIFLYKSSSKKRENFQINLVINNKIKTLDPAVAFNDDALSLMAQSLETLFQYHYLKRPYEVIPCLADGMPSISENGLVYKIKIKKNIMYQNKNGLLPNGRKLVVDDFFWQIKRLAFAPLKSTGAWLFAGKLKGFDQFRKTVGDSIEKFYTTRISGLKKIDDFTFEIHLARPEPNLLYFLSMQFTSPVPIELIKGLHNDLSEVLIGTGPYQLQEVNDEEYLFKRFKNFREEFYPTAGDRYANTEQLLNSSKEKLPFIQKVAFKVIQDEDMRWKMFADEKLDILDVPKKQLVMLADSNSSTNKKFRNDGVIVKHFSKQTTRWLGFNMNDPVIGKNLNLRKAIAYAINYDRYIELLTRNTNLRSNSMFNPSIQGYDPAHRLSYQYSLSLAKKYMKLSGLKPSMIKLTYSSRGKQQLHRDEAQFLKDQLAKIGIKLKVNMIDFGTFLKKGRTGELQFWTDNWIYDYPDAENLLQLLVTKNHPGINKSGYSNFKVDFLYSQLAKTLDKKKRFGIMYQIEDIVEKDLPWVMLMYESTYIIQQKEIKNFRKSFFIRNYIKYLKKLN